jgi:hypothetical protein
MGVPPMRETMGETPMLLVIGTRGAGGLMKIGSDLLEERIN